jgi:hypothetical protein
MTLATLVSSFSFTRLPMLTQHSEGCPTGSFCVGNHTCCWEGQIACGEGKRNTLMKEE